MVHPLVEYFRCPEHLAVLRTKRPLPASAGYFRFGETILYGCQAVGAPSSSARADLVDVSGSVSADHGAVLLPFDLSEVLTNLRYERYHPFQSAIERIFNSRIPHALYYLIRPALPVGVRKHLQRLCLSGWRRIPYPHWPVDTTVETLMREAVRLVLERGGIGEFPFIWFWPEGAPASVMVTHDIEGVNGAFFCDDLMNLDDGFAIRSAFQVVPDAPWSSKMDTRQLVAQLQRRGFEVNVHDLLHDGRLFSDRETFRERAREINARGREFGSRGFRSGAMYRRQDWFASLDFSYDMSVPSVAHLEPQRGGCCTVMPFFIGQVLELPLTTSQDYTLFHVLGDYSTALWREQIDLILARNGLISFIAHPDYLLDPPARHVYTDLLRLLVQLRTERHVWIALPSEIDTWWRNRREMKLVRKRGSWCIEGPGSERARVAYARIEHDDLVWEVDRPAVAA